jgi:hypothetical protein
MENQHRFVSGYRDLTHTEVDLINRIKKMEGDVMELVTEVKTVLKIQEDFARNDKDHDALFRLQVAEPQRWAAMAKTDFQIGFMELVRAVAQPQSPNGNLS